jgi:hypothetical protein
MFNLDLVGGETMHCVVLLFISQSSSIESGWVQLFIGKLELTGWSSGDGGGEGGGLPSPGKHSICQQQHFIS